MDPQEPLLEDISSGDTTKQINALTRLINLSVNGKDISIYFNHIIQYCLIPNDHKLKLLAYRVLKKCNLIDSEWEHKVIPHIARDASGDDQNLAVAALELVHHIPASTILVDFVGKLIFIPTVNHQAPAVRRASVETLSYILLHKKAVLSSKTVVTSLWTSIVGRLLDDTSPVVFQVAFRAVSNLIDAVDNLSPIDDVDSFGDGFHETRARLLRRVNDDVALMLVPHMDLLVKRFDFLELAFRAPAVNVLASLAISIPRDPIAQQAKTGTNLYPVSATGALVSTIVESHLLPFLTHADDSLAFASGKAILKIWSTTESHRRDWAVSATLGLVGILRRETIAISPASVITEILNVLHLIPENHLISCTLKLLTSISDFTESLRRQKNLQQVFDLLVKKDLETEGGIFSVLFKDQWFISVWTTEAPFREELLSAMVTQYSQFQPRYLDTKGKTKLSDKERIAYLTSSLKFIQLCNDTLKWQTGGRTHAIEQFLRFLDWQLEHVKYLPKGEDFDPVYQLQAQRPRAKATKLALSSSAPFSSSPSHSPSHSIFPISSSPSPFTYSPPSSVSSSPSSSPSSSLSPSSPVSLTSSGTPIPSVLRISPSRARIHPQMAQVLERGDCCLRSLISNISIIVSDGICLQVIFIICKYSNTLESQDEQSITSTLQHRFLLLGELTSAKDITVSASKAGSLFDSSVLQVPETPYMQGVLSCLHILGIRFPSMAGVVSQTLDDIAKCHPSNQSLAHRLRVLQSKIEASKNPNAKNQPFAFGQSVIDFSLIPPIENLDALNKFESLNDKFALDYKKSTATPNKQVRKHYHKTHTHKILSGSSDPFGISASHLMRPDIYSIIFRVRITNQMSFAYSHLQVSVGLCGALQSSETFDASQTIKKINPEEKVDLEFPILVTGFEIGSATIHLTFSSLSPGDVSLGSETSLDYDVYGKHYNSTSVVSDVYEFEVGEFLHPTEYTPTEFLKEWNRFPAGFVMDVAFDPSIERIETLFEKLSSISDSFHKVLHWSYSEQYFQLAYSAMSWFEDQLCFTVVGQQPPSSSQIFARFGFRSSDPIVLSIFHRQITRWLDLVVGVGKFALISDPSVSIFCATAGEDEVKLGSDEMYEVEEGLLQQWKSNKYSRSAPPIPVLPSKVETPAVVAPALPPLPPPPPPVVEDDF